MSVRGQKGKSPRTGRFVSRRQAGVGAGSVASPLARAFAPLGVLSTTVTIWPAVPDTCPLADTAIQPDAASTTVS